MLGGGLEMRVHACRGDLSHHERRVLDLADQFLDGVIAARVTQSYVFQLRVGAER